MLGGFGYTMVARAKAQFGLCFMVRFHNETWQLSNHHVKFSRIEIEEEKDVAEEGVFFSLKVVELQLDEVDADKLELKEAKIE